MNTTLLGVIIVAILAFVLVLLRKQTESGSLVTGRILELYSKDLTALAKAGKLDPVIGRKHEIYRVIEILSRRTKNNPVLIGKSGVGKTAIVEELANELAHGNVPEILKSKRILALDLSGLVAGTKYRGEFEKRLKTLVDEIIAAQRHIILFIDEIHTLAEAGEASGAIDAADILKPALARGELQVIGATTMEEYQKYVEKDQTLERRFQPIIVEEPTPDQTLGILKGLRAKYEAYHHVKYSDQILEAIVLLAHKHLKERVFPDKAIDIMDEAGSRVHLTQVESGKGDQFVGEVTLEDLRLIVDNLVELPQKESPIKTTNK
ncbi:ATP-dependent Clp protease ATP-binding subunit [Candidatus Parcubacteria bacterium]|nr:MAG: ATP-dependent Clp protease ATP-binding subunit [Candidatus Parcubacteria bacterium]